MIQVNMGDNVKIFTSQCGGETNQLEEISASEYQKHIEKISCISENHGKIYFADVPSSTGLSTTKDQANHKIPRDSASSVEPSSVPEADVHPVSSIVCGVQRCPQKIIYTHRLLETIKDQANHKIPRDSASSVIAMESRGANRLSTDYLNV